MSTTAAKISVALAKVRGKTIDRVFVVQHVDRGFQLIIAFADASYYEFYGSGDLNGARVIDKGDSAIVRELLSRNEGTVIEIGAGPIK